MFFTKFKQLFTKTRNQNGTTDNNVHREQAITKNTKFAKDDSCDNHEYEQFIKKEVLAIMKNRN